jgi:hypothetical protein
MRMTWDDYERAKTVLRINLDEPPALIMAGVPAVNPKATEPEKQPVRVCDTCYNSQDLI